LAEFTGERAIPGEIDPDLWNEHVARYAFAARFAGNKRVLDAGCGAGYGAAELSQTASEVIALDVAAQALSYVQAHYAPANLRLIQASCAALPLASASVDLVVSFELIEHLPDWREFLAEVRRVLSAGGQFIVSTPNKSYYGQSRGFSGPNPYHVHEFEFEEFRTELARIFPHISLFLQNHADGIVFQPLEAGSPAEVRVEHGDAGGAESHFFVAVCAVDRKPASSTFVYVPRSANVLRERELHIHRLEGELATKDEWLLEASQEHQHLLDIFRRQTTELEERSLWAEDLTRQLEAAQIRIVALQEEFAELQAKATKAVAALEEELARQKTSAGQAVVAYEKVIANQKASIGQAVAAYEKEIQNQRAAAMEAAAGYAAKIGELEQENARRAEWAIQTDARLTQELTQRQQALEDKCRELAKCVELLQAAEDTVVERTLWARSLHKELESATARLNFAKASRWVRLGRAIGLGPDLRNS